jgi:ectoine hydroxylase-related dioxygenase (phytanoyl-CoA dioxygenase family)
MKIKMPFGWKSRIRRDLERVEKLVRSNSYLEAIDLLSASNNLRPSAKAEARLIELRHEALFHIKPESRIGSWPPNSENLFSNIDGIPEISREEFDVEKLRAAIFNNGSLIVRNLISSAEAQAAIADTNRAFENYDAATRGEPLKNSAPWFLPFISSTNLPKGEFSSWTADGRGTRFWVREGGGVLAAESPRAFENFTNLLKRNSIISVIEQYLGERPALSVKKTTLRRVPSTLDTANGWHQDGAFLGEGIRTVNLWIALTDCGVDAPTMDMVPKRLHEIVPTGTHSAAFNWSVAREIVDQYSQGSPPVRLHFKAGDAILFDEMNLHCTAVAPGMTKDRYAIEAWFFAPSCYPMDQLPLIV